MNAGYESASRGRNNLEQVIDGLEHRLDELAAAQRVNRLLVLGGSVLLLGLMGLFGLSLYSTLQRQLNATQLQNALMAKIDEIWPPLSQKFVDSAMQAAPAYGEQAVQRFEKVRPQLESMLLKETEQFSEQLQASLLKKTEAGMQRVTDKVAQDLKRQLPKLTEQKLDAIEAKLRDSLLIEGGGIADELEAKVAKEKIRIEALLAKLPVDEVAKQSEEKLQRQFIHHVLMMIDQSVAADEVASK
jgi:type I site-specific restriction-modification system R (restriction) subunit